MVLCEEIFRKGPVKALTMLTIGGNFLYHEKLLLGNDKSVQKI